MAFHSVCNAPRDGTDATSAIQDAINSGATAFLEGEYSIAGTVEIGNGTATTRSTVHNNLDLLFEGCASMETAYVNPYSGIQQTGVRFKRIGSSTAPLFRINGPINGLKTQGTAVFMCEGTAAVGLAAKSVNNSHLESFQAYHYTQRGFDLDCQPSVEIEGNANGVTTGENEWDSLIAFSPNQPGAIGLALDGYKSAGGHDVTHNRFNFVKYGVNGNGGKGIQWGFSDFNRFGVVVGVCYGTPMNGAAGLHLVGTNSPFKSPASNMIEQFSPGQGLGVTVDTTNGTPRLLFCYMYHMDDAGVIPGEDVAPYFGAVVYQANKPVKTVGLWAKEKFITLDDSSANAGPIITIDRNHGVASSGLPMMQLRSTGRNNAGGFVQYADFLVKIMDASAGSEDMRAFIRGIVNGSNANLLQFGPGVVIGNPTGGMKGFGQVNAEGFFDDGTILT